MPLPHPEDIKAGYTEILTAVAVRHWERAQAKIPWARPREVDLWTADMDRMVRRIHDWERHSVEHVVYLVPADEYRLLEELDIWGPEELDLVDFAATPEQVATVRAAISKQVRA